MSHNAASSSISFGAAASAFSRANSPIAAASVIGTSFNIDGMDRNDRYVGHPGSIKSDNVRAAAIAQATSVEQVIGLVPAAYRQALGPPMHAIAALAEKYNQVERRVANLRSLQWDSPNLPPHLRVKMPEVQCSKEFLSRDEWTNFKATLEADHKAYQTKLLAEALKAKVDELDYLEAELKPSACLEALQPVVIKRWNELEPGFKTPVFVYVNRNNSETVDAPLPGNLTDVRVKDWVTNPTAQVEFDGLFRDLPALSMRILAIVRDKANAMRIKIEKKKKVEADADVEMADLTKPGPSIQSLIDRAVNARIKSLEGKVPQKGKGEKKKTSGKSVSPQDLRHPPKSTPTPSRKLPSVKKAVANAAKSKAKKGKKGGNKGKDVKGKKRAGTYTATLERFQIAY
ncbi:hypothetical protein ACG7TL_006675 [Trametes sanguinea]